MSAAIETGPGRHDAQWQAIRRGLYRFRQSWLSIAGLVIVMGLLLVAALAPWLTPHPEHVAGGYVMNARFAPPSWSAPFGTNELGQDVLSLVIAGTRVSLLAGIVVVIFAAALGTMLGAVAGFAGKWIDDALMRLTDLWLTLPGLILAMALAAAMGPGIGNMIFAITLTWWPGYARLVRGEVLARKEEAYVQAARALGASRPRILFRHILPNVVSPIIVKMSLDVGFAILTVASLGFVGIGVRPPTPEWGSLLSNARGYMPDFWWTAIFPGLAIFLSVFGFNLLGDGLRDVLDPKARR